jgi:uncharacterized protein YicC (UPF0701 family)
MAKVHFNAAIINDLRTRVIDHNQAAPATGAKVTKLEDLKKVYERGYTKHKGRNPGAAAMRRVDSHLEELVKAGSGEFDESKVRRDGDGRFADKPGTAPASPRAQHRTRQAGDPEYRAKTTDVIPDHRGEAIGAMVRDAGAAAAGTALTLSLLRRGKDGAAGRATRWAAGHVGSLAARVPVAIVAQAGFRGAGGGIAAVNAVMRAAAKASGGRLRAKKFPTIDASGLARAVSDRAGRAGRATASAVADGTTTAASWAGRVAVDSVGARPGATVSRRVAGKLKQATVTAALATPPSLLIRDWIKGGMADPEIIGRGIDAFSHREIEKLDQVRGEILAKAAGMTLEEVLTKAMPRLWSRAGMAALPAAAAAAGAAVGAAGGGAAGFGAARRGNPYRDEDGKFTSKERAVTTVGAVGGAIAGAAAAGLGTYAAMRRGNIGAFARRTERMLNLAQRRVSQVIARDDATPRLAAAVKGFDARVRELVAADPEVKGRLAAQARFGGSDVVHFIGKARDEITSRMAEIMVALPATKLPKGAAGKAETVADLISSGNAVNRGLGLNHAHAKLADILDTVDSTKLRQMTAGLTPTQRKTLDDLLARREQVGDEIRNAMAGHVAKIEGVQVKVAAARAKSAQATTAAQDARASVTGVPDDHPTRPALVEAARKADAAFDRAATAERKLVEELEGLRSNPTGAVGPMSGKPLPPPSAREVEAATAKVEQRARASAQAAAKSEIAQLRQAEIARVASRMNRTIGARLALGLKSGAMPGLQRGGAAASQQTAARYAAAARFAQRVEAEERLALTAAATAKQALDGMAPGQRGIAAARAAVKQADARVAEVQSRLVEATARMNRHAEAFAQELAAKARATGNETGARRVLRGAAIAALKSDAARDFRRVRGMAAEPIDRFLASPTSRSLREWAASAASAGGRARTQAQKQFVAIYNTALRERREDGTWQLSWSKVRTAALTRAGLVAALGAGGGATYHWVRDLVLGPEDGKKRSAFPIGTEGSGKPIEIHNGLDSVTGAGLLAISVRDPKTKEQILLWGTNEPGERNPDGTLVPGVKMADVKRRIAEERQRRQQQAGGGGAGAGAGEVGDAKGLGQNEKKAATDAVNRLRSAGKLRTAAGADGAEGNVAFRDHTDFDTNNDAAAKGVRAWLESSDFTSPDGVKGKKLFEALQDGLFSAQGQVLKSREAYRLLTGFDFNGQAAGRGILPKEDGFGKDGDPAEALDRTISYAQSIWPDQGLRDWQKSQLHRAVTLVGTVKNLDAETQKGLHAKIRGSTKPAASTSSTAPSTSSTTPAPKAPAPGKMPPGERPGYMPKRWDVDKLNTAVSAQAKSIARDMGDEDPSVIEMGMWELARSAGRMRENLSESDAAAISGAAVRSMLRADKDGTTLAFDPYQFDVEHFRSALDLALEQQAKVKKGIGLDDIDELDDLVKMPIAFEEAKHRRAHDGQFTFKNGGAASGVAGGRASAAGPRAPKPPAERGLLEPVRLGTEVGQGMASQAVWMAMDRFMPAPARTAAKVGQVALKLGVSSAAGIPGGWAGQRAGEAVYRAKGQRSPGAYEGPNYSGVKDMAADAAGGLAGSLAGMKAGAAAGAVAGPWGAAIGGFTGGVIGGIAGGDLSRRAVRYLSGYGGEGERAMRRFLGGGGTQGLAKAAPHLVATVAPIELSPAARRRAEAWLTSCGPVGSTAKGFFR